MAEQEILYFTKKERTGMLVMMAIIMLLHLFSVLYDKINRRPLKISPEVLQRFALLSASTDTVQNKFTPSYTYQKPFQEHQPVSLFHFDPNTISLNEWKQLGVPEKTAQTILKYISKGGKFRTATDLKKIWGLQNAAEKLIPFVRIQQEQKIYKQETIPPKGQQQKIDINTADSLAWLALPGIGPALTKRILTFRKSLGGFYAVNQVKETFGLPDSTFQKIKSKLVLKNMEIKKINLNDATIDDLKKHPYIRYQLANVIIQYRTQHGKFNAVEQLKNIMILPDSSYQKMFPYLTIN